MKKLENKPSPSEKNRSIRKKVLILLFSFVLQLGLYVGLLALGTLFDPLFFTIGFTVYLSAGAVVLVVYYILNGATFSSPPSDIRRIDSAYADKVEINRKKAKKLHFILLPMAILLLLVFADMFFGEALRSLFG